MRLIETVHIKWYGLYSLNDFYNREEAFKKEYLQSLEYMLRMKH